MIAVVHIHKTAGTTLAGVFKRSYGTRHLDVLEIDRSTPHLTAAELRQTMDRCYPRLDSGSKSRGSEGVGSRGGRGVPQQQAEFDPGLDVAVEEFRDRNSKMTRLQVYANPRYLGYVLKWRLRYRPWVRKMTGDSTAG